MKKLVYEVYVLNNKKMSEVRACKVYSDGTILVIPSAGHNGLAKDEWWQSETDLINKLVKQKKDYPEKLSLIGDWPPDYGYNMPIISPGEDEEAFSTLCLLLHDTPPFEGCEIKYYGKGEPWIPNPEYDPYRIVN